MKAGVFERMRLRPSSPARGLAALMASLNAREDFRRRIRHVEMTAARPPVFHEWPGGLDPRISRAFQTAGISAPFCHQARAFEALQKGRHVLLTTPTASGKTLAFHLPVFQGVAENPSFRALFLYPLKALAQDQWKVLRDWAGPLSSMGLSPPTSEVYDGDTPTSLRAKIRKSPPHVILSNPDMLHAAFLPHHDGWAGFFRDLRLVVVDEAHVYRGVFGTHVAHVLRRLRRVAEHWGSKPRFVVCSATLGNPEEFLAGLTGLSFEVVSESGAPSSEQRFVLWDSEGSPYTEAVTLLLRCLDAELKTIVFTKARKITELLTTWTVQQRPELASRIQSYRAGYLPQERREIERRLFENELSAVIATSALESGIDVGGLDACILVGYPGTMIATRQRSGRVGRQERPSVVFLVAQNDAMDRYWMKHPAKFFSQGSEHLIADLDNLPVAKAQLTCAAAELPLCREDHAFYGDLLDRVVPELLREGALLEGAAGGKWFSSRGSPQRAVSLREAGEGYSILEAGSGRLIGTIDGLRAFRDCHPGAVYLHHGASFVVEDLSWAERKILVREEEVDHYTQVHYDTETEILEETKVRPLGKRDSGCFLSFGRVRVTHRFPNYEVHRLSDGTLVSTYPLSLPPQSFETEGFWIRLPPAWADTAREAGAHFLGGLHAAEHALIALMPLRVLCDRWDLGGLSTPAHPQSPQPTIFVYDGIPGGVGLTEKAFGLMEDLLCDVGDLVASCDCEEGCPACVQSPKCGNGNFPLDKTEAARILFRILGKPLPPAGRAEDQTKRNGKHPVPAPLVPPRNAPPSPAPTPTPHPEPSVPSRTGPVVFDLETRFLSGEVAGGWSNVAGMKLACAVVYDVERDAYFTYREEDVRDLLARLKAASLVVGFNSRRFDYAVLQPYADFFLGNLPTLDLLEEVQKRTTLRVSLSDLCRCTLGADKTADGLQAVKWWREGRYEEVIAYCREDVRLTHDLWKFGREKGYVLFRHKRSGEVVKCPVQW